MFLLPREQFFRKSDKQNLKKCKLHKKRQWMRKANTILRIYRRRRELNPQTQTLYRALGVTPTSLHRLHNRRPVQQLHINNTQRPTQPQQDSQDQDEEVEAEDDADTDHTVRGHRDAG